MRADPTYINSLTQALNNTANTTNSLSSELSSGLRVTSLSDDPIVAAESIRLGSTMSGIDTFVANAATQSSMLQVTDSTLGDVVTQLTSASTLAIEAANGTMNSSDLKALTQQVIGIRDQILGLANTSYQGRYLFAGSQGTTQPYSVDDTTVPATAVYAGDTVTQSIETPGGQMIQMNLPGSSIFGSGSTGTLATLNQLIADLQSGADTDTLSADSAALNNALSNVSTQRSVLDASLSTLKATSTYAQTQNANLQAIQSTLVSADPAAIATQLKTNETQYEALLGVISSMNSTNLFDYLK
ncbi:MAG: flagellar hook-associated protein FlgL [Edaphobacter sp.]|uniref:flagellar hook-associated protein FlgL n=1 Tax=Edaphobacter sp. TaxID=1934404 RepID=UPI0023A3D93B|nr:flagellar hook-associated protein FlgL [Edaphobacter sp.]MDE1175127.1 flagellar hook-associated protein FlgL [Edaphobacter sp.]